MLRTKKQILIICFSLTAITLLAFWQVNRCDFLNFDDPAYVSQNVHIRSGITVGAIRWAFTTDRAANWHPLTWLSHMLDVQLFGLNPRWHHLTNLLFHIANTLLLFFVFYRMTGALWQSGFVAALFALHPLHVESVAWVAERKDVLSTFFWMLTMVAYARYARHPRFRSYLVVFACFACGLMAKPMLVTLPFVLLLLDYWPLRRLEKESVHNLLLEKLPLLALAGLSCVLTFLVQQKAALSLEGVTPGMRIANAFISYVIYIEKTIWPHNLAVFYPHPGSWPFRQVLGAVVLLISITFTVIWAARRLPYLAVGWLWFAGTLVPVIGIVQVGRQAMADRYTYIPLIGLFIMAAWGIPELLKKWGRRKEALFAVSASILSCLLIAAWIQVGYWQNDIALYDHTLKVTSRNDVIHCNRGCAYSNKGDFKRGIEDFDRAIKINPRLADAYNFRALAYSRLGKHVRAIADFDKAIEINPKLEAAYNGRGCAYFNIGQYRQAIRDFDKSIEINPKFADAYKNRAIAVSAAGDSG